MMTDDKRKTKYIDFCDSPRVHVPKMTKNNSTNQKKNNKIK